jgi:hypothetical protein
MPKQATVPAEFTPQWLASLDARTSVAQAMRARYLEITNDLGGEDSLSYLQKSLIARYMWAEFWIQQQEQSMAAGQEVDIGKYVQASNNLVGLSNRLGLERKAKNVPSLADFIAKREAGK